MVLNFSFMVLWFCLMVFRF